MPHEGGVDGAMGRGVWGQRARAVYLCSLGLLLLLCLGRPLRLALLLGHLLALLLPERRGALALARRLQEVEDGLYLGVLGARARRMQVKQLAEVAERVVEPVLELGLVLVDLRLDAALERVRLERRGEEVRGKASGFLIKANSA